MRVNYGFAFLFVFILTGTLLGGELKFTPDVKIYENTTLNFNYESGDFFNPGEQLNLGIYAFKNNLSEPVAFETGLVYNNTQKAYTGKFTVPEGTVYALLQVVSRNDADNNRGKFWDFMVLDSTGKPVEGANLKAGISYLGNLPGDIDREPDFPKALELLKKEVELYPANIQAQIGLVSLKYDLKMIGKDEFEQSLASLVRKPFDINNEDDVRAVSRALKILNKKSEAQKLESDFVAAHPESSLSEEMFIADLAKAASRKEFSDGVDEYLKKFPTSSGRERIFSALVQSYLQSHSYELIRDKLASMKDVPSSSYVQLAFAVIEDEKIFADSGKDARANEALDILGKAMTDAENENYIYKPDYMLDTEWKRKIQAEKGVVYEAYGKVYLYKNDYAKAVENYNKAKDLLGNEASSALYENLTEAYFDLKDFEKALVTAQEAVLASKQTDVIEKLYPELYKEAKGDTADYTKAWEALLIKAKENRIKELKKMMLNQKVKLGEIETLNGIKIDLSLIKGKVIIIQFWSTWCGPCADALTALESLYHLYKGNSNVVIAAVDIWEKSQDPASEVDNYLGEGDFDLPVYLDNSGKMPQNFGVLGLPVRYFLDQNGVIQFKEVGFLNEEESIQSASDKIELLLSEKK